MCAAFDNDLHIMSGAAEPGRDRVSLLRLWLSYKITALMAIGRCPIVGGTNVPHIRILITRVSLHAAYPKTMLPNLSIV